MQLQKPWQNSSLLLETLLRGSFLICSLSFAFGCSGGSDYMPLEEGREWKYLVSTPAGSSVARMKVEDRVRVGLSTGWRIAGSSGENRLAWRGGELVASELSTTSFEPPIVILKPSTNESTWRWKGKMRSRGNYLDATAECSQRPDKVKVAGNERNCLLSTLRLTFGDSTIELRSWFQSGVGVVRQEQHVDGRLTTALEWIGGT